MRNKFRVFLLIPLIVLTFFAQGNAMVESDVLKTLKIEKTPLDVAVSFSGRWVFVLTNKGKILIYSSNGKLNDTISVDKSIDSIKVGGREDIIFLISRKNKTFHILALDFIKNIDISGSPFKGPTDAPVVITVFSDFQ
jgi:hypothetical protein